MDIMCFIQVKNYDPDVAGLAVGYCHMACAGAMNIKPTTYNKILDEQKEFYKIQRHHTPFVLPEVVEEVDTLLKLIKIVSDREEGA